MTTYELVTLDEAGHWLTERFPNLTLFLVSVVARGAVARRTTSVETDRRLRRELQGQPVFDRFNGPLWGGTDESGSPVVRYENWRAAEVLSA